MGLQLPRDLAGITSRTLWHTDDAIEPPLRARRPVVCLMHSGWKFGTGTDLVP
jgi:hypothetical protein